MLVVLHRLIGRVVRLLWTILVTQVVVNSAITTTICRTTLKSAFGGRKQPSSSEVMNSSATSGMLWTNLTNTIVKVPIIGTLDCCVSVRTTFSGSDTMTFVILTATVRIKLLKVCDLIRGSVIGSMFRRMFVMAFDVITYYLVVVSMLVVMVNRLNCVSIC